MSIFYAVGRYACKVTDQALGETSNGNPQFVLKFQVLGLVDPKDPNSFIPATQQYERTHYRAITDKSIVYFADDLKALGFAGESFKMLSPDTAGFHDFTGLDIDMWCEHEDSEKGRRERWGVARVSKKLEVKPIEAKKLRDLDNLFGKHLKGNKPATRPAPVNAPTSDPSITDDDVPF